MRKNKIQSGVKDNLGKTVILNDWFNGFIPDNVRFGEKVYIDSAFGFAQFQSTRKNGMLLGKESASYDRATFVTDVDGKIVVGENCILNGTTLICSELITIGNFVMLAWGSVISDNFLSAELSSERRAAILEASALSQTRKLPFSTSDPVTLEDNVWIGFDAIVLPGTHIGRGSIIASKSVVSGIIPEYSIVVGNPANVIKTLDSTDKKWFENPQYF